MKTFANGNQSRPIRCYGQYLFNGSVQEHYETGSVDARQRGKLLRTCGFRVISAPIGPQVTSVGTVKMTVVTAYGDMDKLPSVDLVRI